MRFDVSSRIVAGTKRALAVLAIVAGFSLAAPTAFADISFIATDTTNGGTTNNGTAPGNGNALSFNNTVGAFSVQIQSSRTDPNPSTLSTTTIDINNTGTKTSTLEVEVSSKGYTTTGPSLVLSSTIQGTSSNAAQGQSASGQSWIDNTNTLFGMPAAGTAGSLTGTANANGATVYTFPNSGVMGNVSVPGPGPFSLTEIIFLTLAPGKQGQITISASVNAVPEPSSMAIAGLGALGMIGYGLRRRKALGA